MRISAVIVTAIALTLASLVASVAMYDRLPDPVPTHFDLRGEPNGFTPKPFGALMGPIVLAVLGAILIVLPRISPRGYLFDQFERTYELIAIATLVFVFAVTTAELYAAIHKTPETARVILISIGVLLVVIGNYLGKLTRNFFVGIRTPWTLASPEVWFRTHRVGGPLFVLCGLFMIVSAALGADPIFGVSAIIVTSLILVVYSYVAYRRIEGAGDDHEIQS